MPTYFSCRTGQWGSPRKRLTVLATDKGHDAKVLRHQELHQRGSGHRNRSVSDDGYDPHLD
jgi:hypothetical protein